MSKINLLPWREELRKSQNKIFFVQLGLSVALSMALVFLMDMLFSYRISVQQANIAYLNKELKSIEATIEEIKSLQDNKNRLIERMNVIRSLQFDRPSIVKLLDMLPRVVPENIYLTEVSRSIPGQITPGSDVTQMPDAIELNPSPIANIHPKDPEKKPETPVINNTLYKVTVSGVAQTNGSISVFLKKLEGVQWVSGVKLDEVSINKEGQGLNFTLEFNQHI